MAILVKYSGDWSDEFTCEEFKIFGLQSQYDDWLAAVQSNIDNYNTEFYFGTKEFQEFNTMNDLTHRLTIHQITDEEAEIFKKYFGDTSFGTSGVFHINEFEEE